MEEQSKSQRVSIEDLKVDTTASTDSTATTIYHIYHTGKGKRPPNYSIHSIRDSETTILAPVKIKKTKEEKKKAKEEKKQAKADKKNSSSSESTAILAPSSPTNTLPIVPSTVESGDKEVEVETVPPQQKPLKGLKKLPKLDDPLHDPRTETAPYFLHLPKVAGHEPPYTLRYTGHKRGPVAALVTPKGFWWGWKLEFGDVLREEGVVDGRGVVGIRFGVKDVKEMGENENGDGRWLKGYKLGKRRWWGESGKEYYNQQKEAGFPANEEVDVGEKARAEEVVRLKWVGLWKIGRVREYSFAWRGFEFVWKGTRKVVSKKGHTMWVWCNHLKLVVTVKEEEVCLARYCCVLGNRKAGRLEIDEGVVEGFLKGCVLENGSDVVSGNEDAKTRQRLLDVMVGTMICMLITERNKRRWLLEFLQEVGENAGG